jgi:signal transduction histidine kinase
MPQLTTRQILRQGVGPHSVEDGPEVRAFRVCAAASERSAGAEPGGLEGHTSRMSSPVAQRCLNILHLEDSELDHELIGAHLRRGGLVFSICRVETEAEFRRALERDWDLVLSDYNLPGYSGLRALELVRSSRVDLPFVLLSGEIGEDAAVGAMRKGASDYLLKNNIARLVPSITRAIEAAETLRARHVADAALLESKQRLHELAQHLQSSIEMERAAIAREIHDDVGGSLTAIKFDLAWIARHSPSPDVHARVASALETVRLAIESSQRIMHGLRPAILEQGLVAALQWMCSRFEKRTGVHCRLVTPRAMPGELPPGVPLVAYRTAQEALTNITKHARATEVQVDLSMAAGVLSLEVSDNGRGLTADDLAKARSFGIRGLQERSRTVGGWIDLTSGVGGTSLILSVPLSAAASDAAREQDEDNHGFDPTGWGDT